MLGDTIKLLREQRGLTQQQVAEQMNITRSKYSKFENNVQEPSATELKKLSKVLKFSVDLILYYEDESDTDYIERFNAVEKLNAWIMREPENAKKIIHMANEFDGDFGSVILMSYLYTMLPISSRKHIAAMVGYTFNSECARGMVDITDEEHKALINEYRKARLELEAKDDLNGKN